MLKRALLALLAVPAIAGLTLVAVRLTPGPQRDGTTLLPSGWRIHPAGRQVDVGTLPLNVVTLSDGSVLVTNGTNASVLPNRRNARELCALVEIGMTPAQAV